jgi:hypothetical protein
MPTDKTSSLISLFDAQSLHLTAMKGVIALLAVDADRSADENELMVTSPQAIGEALLSLELHIESAQEAVRGIMDSLPLNAAGDASVSESSPPEFAGAETNAPQDPHIAWFAEWEALLAQWQIVSREEGDDKADLLMNRITALENLLFNTPAHTPEGQKYQTQAAITEFQKTRVAADPETTEAAYERVLVEAAMRSFESAAVGKHAGQASGHTAGQDPHVAWYTEMQDLRRKEEEIPERSADEESDALLDKADDLEEKIIKTPARTKEGRKCQALTAIEGAEKVIEDYGAESVRCLGVRILIDIAKESLALTPKTAGEWEL